MWEASTLASCLLTGSVFSHQSLLLYGIVLFPDLSFNNHSYFTKAALRRDQLRDRPDERPGGENRARQVTITTFFCLEELRVDCKSDLDHVNLVKLTINSNVYSYLSLSATYSTQIPWKRRPHYWADEKGLWSRYLFPSIYFSWCKKYSPIVRHQEDKAFAIVFLLFIISSDPSTHFISKQLVRLSNNDQKSWSYPDHVDHVKLILLSVAHLILDCCYNDVTTPAAFIFAIWLGYLVRPLREQGVFFLYFQNWCCQFVKSIPQTGHYDMNFTK